MGHLINSSIFYLVLTHLLSIIKDVATLEPSKHLNIISKYSEFDL